MNLEQESQKNLSLGDQAMLQAHKARLDNYTESNKACIEFSKMCVRATLLLNGIPAMYIFYAHAHFLYGDLWLFEIGAALSVCCGFFTYLCQLTLTKCWGLNFKIHPGNPLDPKALADLQQEEDDCSKLIELYRAFAFLCAGLSLLFFLIGSYFANNDIKKGDVVKRG